MPIITKFVCDRCKEEVQQGRLFNVSIVSKQSSRYTESVDVLRIGNGYSEAHQHQSAVWCADCCATVFHVDVLQDRKKDLPGEPYSLEDAIREIVREEIEGAR